MSHWLFESSVLNFHLWDFLVTLLLFISSSIAQELENVLCIISISDVYSNLFNGPAYG